MTEFVVKHSGFRAEIGVGTRIVDLCDDNPRSEVPFSCRAASCGTCRCRVLEGMDAFPTPAEDEQAVLDVFGDPSDVRLACQLRVKRDVPRVVLEVLEP